MRLEGIEPSCFFRCFAGDLTAIRLVIPRFFARWNTKLMRFPCKILARSLNLRIRLVDVLKQRLTLLLVEVFPEGLRYGFQHVLDRQTYL